MSNVTKSNSYSEHDYRKYDLVILALTGNDYSPLDEVQSIILQNTIHIVGDPSTTEELISKNKTVVGLIVLCPVSSLKGDNIKAFKRPFTVVVNQPGRMMTDIFSLLTTLPITKN